MEWSRILDLNCFTTTKTSHSTLAATLKCNLLLLWVVLHERTINRHVTQVRMHADFCVICPHYIQLESYAWCNRILIFCSINELNFGTLLHSYNCWCALPTWNDLFYWWVFMTERSVLWWVYEIRRTLFFWKASTLYTVTNTLTTGKWPL